MSNTSKGKASKGSKFMMQIAASRLQKQIIDTKINDELVWLSPIEDNEYEEYQLSEHKVCDFLGITPDKHAFEFWPARQPQWDGIAIGRNSGILYLFEAKSHLKETKTDCSASSEISRKQISETMWQVANGVYGLKDRSVFEHYWMNSNYQLANRLTFLHKMKELSTNARFYDNVKLVLLNFVNDPTWDKNERVSSAEQWTNHYNHIMEDMKVERSKATEQGLIELNYSAPYIF